MKAISMFSLLVFVSVFTAYAQESNSTFASVVIKPGQPAHPVSYSIFPGGKFVGNNLTASMLIQLAFETRELVLSRAPSWIAQAEFDIVATPIHSISRTETSYAIRAMLQERFKLAIHRSLRDLSTCSVVVGGEPKMVKAPARRNNGRWGSASPSP